MSEIRGRLQNVFRFPRALPCVSHVWQTTQWIHASVAGTADGPNSWRLIEDTDRSLLLIPLDRPEPGFVITPCDGEYEVMVCEPDDVDELGPFSSLSDALDGITTWLALPAKDLPADDLNVDDLSVDDLDEEATATPLIPSFRSSFAVPCPRDLFFGPHIES